MALTQTQVSELYVAIFGRASEKEGSDYWSSLPYDDFVIADGMLADPSAIAYFGSSLDTNQAFIEHIYFNTFNRTVEQDPSGIEFWVNALDAGYTRGFIVTEIIEAVKREPETSEALMQFNNRVEVSNFYADTLDEPNPNKIMFVNDGGLNVTADPATVDEAKADINDVKTQNVFTLKQATDEEVTAATYSDPVLVTMWGYNPHSHDETNVDNFDGNNADSDAFDDEDANEQGNATNLANEGIEDGGVPLHHLITYIEDLADLEFSHLGLLGDEHVTEAADIDVTNNDDGTVTISVTNAEGEIASAEVEMTDYVFNLIHDAIFDPEGNSRLFQQELYYALDSEGNKIADPYVAGGFVYSTEPQELTSESTSVSDIPTVLTTEENNGGTEESGYTSALDDTIVVGRLDLLHGAYIDAGEGDNTLEIDAKGHFAQPKALLNIQTISIQNLPNIYTEDDQDNTNAYPDVQEPVSGGGDNDSVIDISRAMSLENLIVSEGDFESLDAANTDSSDLTVTGIRNGATVTLDGNFDGDALTLHFRETAEEGVNVVLHNVNFDDGDLVIAHNAPVLNLDSTGAGNVIENANLSQHGANLMQINVTGDAKLFISSSLDDAFVDGHPATIDASGNTAGVDLRINGYDDEIVFIGTAADDHFYAYGDRSITITGNEGDNEFYASGSGDVTVTALDGNNEIYAYSDGDDDDGIELEDTVTVTVGNGQNDIYVSSEDAFSITAGNGDNRIEAWGDTETGVTDADEHSIVVGDGQNEIDAGGAILSITTGNGDNEIDVDYSESLTITTGTGNDVIAASGDSDDASVTIAADEGDNTITVTDFGTVVVTTGSGNDSLTIEGGDLDFGSEDGGSATVSGENGDETSITVDLGAGTNTLTLDSSSESRSVTATPDSTITGENITLVVQSDADLSRATVSGVTAVQLGNADSLTLTVSQFVAMGGSTSFSTIGEAFNAKSYITLIVDQDTSLDDLDIESLPRSIDLAFEIKDGVQLEMTAQQLHERVISEGVSLFVDDNTDFNSGTVLITGAGIDFDPFNNNDQVRTADADGNYLGGSLATGANGFATDADLPLDGIQRDEWGSSVLLDRTLGGYDRPADAPSYSRIVIDTDTTSEIGPFETIETFLRIVGDSDLTFTPAEGGIDEWGRPQPEGTAIELATDSDGFLVDFSSVTGSVNNLTLAEFQKVDAIYGNGDNAYARVNVELNGDVATALQGLISDGVQEFVVTEMNDSDHDFFTCETTKDLEVLGLRGNYGDEISFLNTERGVEFLMETVYVKSEGYVVGELHGEFARSGADAVVNVVAIDTVPAGETQMVEGITLVNADTALINVTGGDTEIVAFDNGDATDITVTADADLTLPEISDNVEMFDASGVTGTLTVSFDPDGAGEMTIFEGAAGATTLTLHDVAVDDIASIDGVGEIALVIDDVADLTETALNNVTSVTLDNGATLSITMDDADTIGAANFHVAEGDTATLNLVGLSDQVFALANYDVDGTINVTLTLANDPVVTLNAATDLTGITSLVVPEGTVLELTAAQFQQLDGNGTITGNGSVHITDVTQADVGEGGTDFSIDDITLVAGADGVATITITAAETLDLSDADFLNGATTATLLDVVNFGDDMTLTFGNFEDLDGVEVNGGTNSTVIIADASAPVAGVDASSWSFSEVHFLNVVADTNVDEDLFVNLPETIEKVVVNGEGTATPETQVVFITEQTSVNGSTIFNKSGNDQDTVEIVEFTLNLEGGTEIDGDLELSTDAKINPDNGARLLTTGLGLVTINSTGTEANLFTNETANVIDGWLTPIASNGAWENNTLTTVVINAEQVLTIDEGIIFNSWSDGDTNDGWTINDVDDAAATVTVNGSANVNLGTIKSTDDDVDSVTINNAGTGTVTVRVDGTLVDDNGSDNIDALAFTGSNIVLTTANTLDLSDDDLSAVTSVSVEEGGNLSVTYAQFNAIGAANFTVQDTDNNELNDAATITIVGFDGTSLDTSALSDEFSVVLEMAAGDITLDASVDLTGVNQIIVPEGGSITMTADQYQQMTGDGLITGVDATGAASTEYTVNITGLAQANVDLNLNPTVDSDTADVGEGFDLSNVSADTITVDVVEDVNFDANTVLNGASLTINSFHLGLATEAQAHGLTVMGDGTSIVSYLFDIVGPQVEAAGYDIGTLRALAISVDGTDVEFLIDNLANSVTLSLYEDPNVVGYVSDIHRVVIIEDGVAVPGNVIFNGDDDNREMRTLTITFEGDANDGRTVQEDADGNLEGSVIAGNLVLDADPAGAGLVADLFDTLTLNSQGTGDSNAITGNISGFAADNGLDVDGDGDNTDNNLLNVVVNADAEFTIGGDIKFSSINADATANLTVNGSAPVTVNQLDVSDADITALAVANNGTSTLTVTGASPAIIGAVETVTFTGTGDIALGTIGEGITDDTISSVDASGLSGALTMDDVTDVDDAAFTFTSGTGVTTMNFSDTDLDSSGVDATINTTDDTAGWTLDFTNAAAGSELHLSGTIAADATAGSAFTVLGGANTTIYIDSDYDLSGLAASLPAGSTIVLGDEFTLTLTAAQADGLTIISGPDVDGDTNLGTVNIVNLGDTAVDLSGIAADIAGTATLEDNDVTLDAATDLGSLSVTLSDVADGTVATVADELQGQTIRFATVEQAERAIIVGPAAGDSSTNVVWLFDSVTGPVNTNDYSASLERLWFTETLADGANIEDLFTSLPNTILRVDFADLDDLDTLLTSLGVNRTIELASFTTLGAGLIFNDQDVLEHVETLTIDMGGQVTVGNITLDNIIDNTATYTAAPTFTSLTINSVLADDSGDLLARENFDETVNVKPTSGNTVGDISVGADDNIDLTLLNIRTGVDEATNDLTTNDAVNVLTGTNLNVGTVTFDSDPADPVPVVTVTLDVEGANDVNITSVDTSDVDIDAITTDTTGFTGTLTAPGASPAFMLDNTETLTFTNSNDTSEENSVISLGSTATPNAGVAGNELSFITATTFDGVLDLGIVSSIDSNDDDTDGDLVADQDAFTFTAGGFTTMTLATANGSTPTLDAGSTWNFDFAAATALTAGQATARGTGTAGDLSELRIEDASFGAGSNLVVTLNANSSLYIDAGVDLSGVNLTVTGGDIEVVSGATLTITVAQLAALDAAGVDIVGAGSLVVTGDGTDATATIFESARTANLSVAGVTIDGTDADGNLDITLLAAGALDALGGAATGIAVTGSAEDDVITGTDEDDTFTMGAGDDTITGGSGDDTFNVTSGTDTITDLGDDDVAEGDVLVVSAGATADATGIVDFVATAATMNDGTATLTGADNDQSNIDLSLVTTGTNGFTIDGGASGAADDGDTLLGSALDDTINGGNDTQEVAGDVDVLTGNAGADTFVFDISQSNPIALTQSPDTAGDDVDQWDWDSDADNVAEGFAADVVDSSQELTILYRNDATVTSFTILDDATIDFTSGDELGTAIATGLTARGVAASYDTATDLLTLDGTDGQSVELISLTVTAAGALTDDTPAEVAGYDAGNDVPQVTDVTVGTGGADTAVAGEIYSITVTLAEGQEFTYEYTAAGGETEGQIATALEAGLDPLSGEYTSAVVGNVVTITDADGDNGGFTVSLDNNPGISGTGASALGAGAGTFANIFADTITDFVSGEDMIQLNVAGTNANYLESGNQTSYATAYAAANAAFDGTVRYYLTSTDDLDGNATADDASGLLFFDANGDSTADGVILLTGITSANFDETDIIA